jgi:hypothetical protein
MKKKEDIKIKNTTTNDKIKENDENIKICIICTDEIRDGENISTIACSHIFHENCLKKWMEVKTNCPICRFQFGIDLNDEQHELQEIPFSFIINGGENMIPQNVLNEVLNDMMFGHNLNFEVNTGQLDNNDNFNPCVMVMVRMHHRLLQDDIPFNEMDIELQSNIEMLHQQLQTLEELGIGQSISTSIQHETLFESTIQHRVTLYDAIMKRIDYIFCTAEKELQNLENTPREEVEHHMAEIEEMRQMSKQEHENNTKMELFTLKVLPFIRILVPQMELLNSILQTNVENGTEILHNVEHNLPSINQQMVNLDAEAVRNAMQNSHIMYQTARQTYTNFTNLYGFCNSWIDADTNTENFDQPLVEEEIPDLVEGSSDSEDSDVPSIPRLRKESDESENLCEQIFFQDFNENEILQIFEGNIQNNYTVPITQTDSVPISQNLLEEPQQEQNNESILDEIIFEVVQQLTPEEEEEKEKEHNNNINNINKMLEKS